MIKELQKKISINKSKKEFNENNLLKIDKEISSLQRDERNIMEAQKIIQHVAQKTQQELRYKISEIVTLALEAVFDDPYEFKIEFIQKRGKTEAVLKYVKDGHEYDPTLSTGGGVKDITSFALRIAIYQIRNPKLRNVIVLDEPFKQLSVSGDMQEKAGEMLQKISHKLGIQIIMNSHVEKHLDTSDKVFRVSKSKKTGISYVEEI